MKVKDLLGKFVKNKRNGQLSTCLKKSSLKKVGISQEEFLDMKIDKKLRRLLDE